jgi:hypothetical protein
MAYFVPLLGKQKRCIDSAAVPFTQIDLPLGL